MDNLISHATHLDEADSIPAEAQGTLTLEIGRGFIARDAEPALAPRIELTGAEPHFVEDPLERWRFATVASSEWK